MSNANRSLQTRNASFMSKVCKCITFQNKKLRNAVNVNNLQWKGFKRQSEYETLPPIFALLIDLYDGKDVYGELEACRINPDFSSNKHLRNDLEYYVPQLTNFMAFHGDFANQKLNGFLENLSKADPYFAHLYYWYINSLSHSVEDEKGMLTIRNILNQCSKESQTQVFLKDYERFYFAMEKKLEKEEYHQKLRELQARQAKIAQLLHQYKTSMKLDESTFNLRASDLELKPYISPFLEGDQAYSSNPFTSTLLFFEDLYHIAQAMNNAADKLAFLKKRLSRVNRSLPSSVYIPFVKESIRMNAVLDIVVEETKIFSTKERSPFYVILELFNPHEELAYEYNSLFPSKDKDGKKKPKAKNIVNWAKKAILRRVQANPYQKMGNDNSSEQVNNEEFKISDIAQIKSSPVTLKKMNEAQGGSPVFDFKSKDVNGFGEPKSEEDLDTHENEEHHHNKIVPSPLLIEESKTDNGRDLKIDVGRDQDIVTPTNKPNGHFIGSPLSCNLSPFVDVNSLNNYLEENDPNEEEKEEKKEEKHLEDGGSNEALSVRTVKDFDEFFGEDSKAQEERIRSQSLFKDLETWRLLPMIVKTGADMKEEQFAVQLISQFNQIFKEEKLKLILTPYEIVSLGPDVGLVEVIQDAITMSSLKEKTNLKRIPSLKEFFEIYHGKDVEKARKRFCRSLAAYSLVCYFLQIKDRHNGNIFLHKQGHIIHIDFGFFLSNSPGRGLEFEKKVPFKLLYEYIEVLGGFRSNLFQEFRKLFYKGFLAARKHREQILILVKMMYSSQGGNLPCFKAGLRAIDELEQRFCPPDVAEKDLIGYCYNMINQSADNWRAKCYDKFQYYVQGIHY